MRAFNEAGQIGYNKSPAKLGAVTTGAAISIDNPEIGLQRGEWIVGNFGARRRDHGNQSGFARVGVADQPDIRQEFQFEAKMALFTGESVLMFARGLMPGLGKVLIAASAASAVGDEDALARRGEVSDGSALIVKHQRADRNLQNHVLSGVAGAVGAFSVGAAIGLEFAVVAVAQQRVVVLLGFPVDVAAIAAVASGGAAARNIFLAPQGHAAGTPIAGLHEYFCFI